jgi:ATP-dependent Clp protease adaptor protein ClpS
VDRLRVTRRDSAGLNQPDMPTIVTPETGTDTGVSLDTPWSVIIHNDPVNLMSYVTLVIRKIFGYPEKEAERLMLQVHQEGRSVVWTGLRERAEHYVRELHAHQLLATLQQAN